MHIGVHANMDMCIQTEIDMQRHTDTQLDAHVHTHNIYTLYNMLYNERKCFYYPKVLALEGSIYS